MNLIRKITSAVTAAGVALSGAVILTPERTIEAEAAAAVSISPYDRYDINNGIFEGWGTSLCWWANRVGYSDTLAQKCADTFYGDDGLRLNIARFNIGGGDDPSHDHITRTDSNMPGYTRYNNGNVTYDWTADYNQRNVLQRSIKAAGDDMIVEMFSNSPPYYMTNSGCSTGNKDAGSNNLKDDCYDDFAEYMAEVCDHYQNVWGIDVQSVEPMNEPYTNFWGAYSAKQEGCHFDWGDSESRIITELRKALDRHGLQDAFIAGTDETSIDTQIDCYNKLSSDAKNVVKRIDTHTYGGSKRTELRSLALSSGKNLWMSEVDGSGTAGTNAGEMSAALWLAERIATDCNGLNSSAWILWQVIDNHISSVGYNGKKDKGMVNTSGGFWGLAVADHDKNDIILTKKYYAMGQYSRYIRPGMTMLKVSDNSMAAYDEKNGQLVIVAYNTSGSASGRSYDLRAFSQVGSSAQVIRTSQTENWKDAGKVSLSGSYLNVDLAPNSVTTFIIDGVKGGGQLENKIDLSGAVITGTDSWKSDSSTGYIKAFDGSLSTYFDGVGDGWVQVDLGQQYDISGLGYCPRSGYEYRMTDGFFQYSDDGENWKTFLTIDSKPSYGMHYRLLKGVEAVRGRYIRYAVPHGKPADSSNNDSTYCCNVAELELYGLPATGEKDEKITPVSISGSNSWKDDASTSYEKAFDGDTSTYFDGVGDGWIQVDLGELYDISNIGYCARNGYEYRMTDGRILVSADGTNWTKVHTVDYLPGFGMEYTAEMRGVKARYVRYEVPEGAPANSYNKDSVYCCNIAELAVYGRKAAVEEASGDVNKDGSTNLADLVMLQRFVLRRTDSLTDWKASDLDGDGIITAFDITLLRQELIDNA